jgi:hypothetical protein
MGKGIQWDKSHEEAYNREGFNYIASETIVPLDRSLKDHRMKE